MLIFACNAILIIMALRPKKSSLLITAINACINYQVKINGLSIESSTVLVEEYVKAFKVGSNQKKLVHRMSNMMEHFMPPLYKPFVKN